MLVYTAIRHPIAAAERAGEVVVPWFSIISTTTCTMPGRVSAPAAGAGERESTAGVRAPGGEW
jgi:hypothetical protein